MNTFSYDLSRNISYLILPGFSRPLNETISTTPDGHCTISIKINENKCQNITVSGIKMFYIINTDLPVDSLKEKLHALQSQIHLACDVSQILVLYYDLV